MDTTSKRKQLSSRLKKERLSQDMTQSGLAEKAGIERKTINRIEKGHYSPNIDTLLKVCKALKVKPAKILEKL